MSFAIKYPIVLKSIASYAPPVAMRCPVMGKVRATANWSIKHVIRALNIQFLRPPLALAYTPTSAPSKKLIWTPGTTCLLYTSGQLYELGQAVSGTENIHSLSGILQIEKDE